MGHIVLLGDSVFDNAAYVPDQPDVVTQLRSLLPGGWTASLNAVDGSVTCDVKRQLDRLPPDTTHLVVSVGGNDALCHTSLGTERVRSVSEVVHRLAEIKGQFRDEYRAMLDAALACNLPTAICTVYRGNFDDPEMQKFADVGTSIFNDVITSEASARSLPLIDLRVIFDDKDDYANPIEPSAIGGEKIARAILELLTGRLAPAQ
jgi:hypothetical protein